jgi:hypothetical protein
MIGLLPISNVMILQLCLQKHDMQVYTFFVTFGYVVGMG